MNPEDAKSLEDDTLLSLAAYCDEALADGRAPDLRQADRAPEEQRSDLEGRIDCMRLLRRVWAGDSGAASSGPRPSNALTAMGIELSASSTVSPATRIGRFEVRRELGRGGFGVVFLARDPLLHRDVALKVPRTEAFLDPELRARLHREATIAAGLDHPNIVPIYEAGEAGPVCYIASAFCPGVTLAAWLKEQPVLASFRDAAALAATLAEAVHYAHQRGVVHRDLKPANILLVSGWLNGEDRHPGGSGTTHHSPLTTYQPRITDFGLAKLLDDKKSPANALTQAGAVIGTPEYMAPEQARTAAGPVGPATDVYALGVILYEMLTGRPPFQGDSTLEILRQVETAEPVPLGRLRPKLPRDLETICLKCLEKESKRRYSAADALTADLRHFLAGEPVQARPVSRAEKMWRWCHRKPAIAALLTALALVFLAGSSGVLWQWQRATRERDTARLEKKRAERHLQIVRERVKVLGRLGHELLQTPGKYHAGQAVLQQALAFYQELLPEEGDDPEVRREAASLYGQVAWIHHILAQEGEAADAWDDQARLLTGLLKENPADAALRMELADVCRWQGNALRSQGQIPDALQAYGRAAVLHEELQNEFPDNPGYRVALANTLLNMAPLLSAQTPAEEQERLYRRMLELFRAAVQAAPNNTRFKAEMALGLEDQGKFFLGRGQPSLAEAPVREALKIHQRIRASGQMKDAIDRAEARTLVCLAQVLAACARVSEAEESYRKAGSLLDRPFEDSPEGSSRRAELAQTLVSLANLLKETDRREEVADILRRAIHHYEKLQADFPDNTQYQLGLVFNCLRLIRLLDDLGRSTEAAEPYRKSMQLESENAVVNNERAWFLATSAEPRWRDAARAVRLAQKAVSTQLESGNYRNTLGAAHFRAGDDKAAIAELDTAMSLRAGGDSLDWFFLAMAHWRLGDRDKARTWFDRAVQWMDKNKPNDDELRRFRKEAETMLSGTGKKRNDASNKNGGS
jgi:serine/threonine protein kinase/Tfp pilus assembly protein PilF